MWYSKSVKKFWPLYMVVALAVVFGVAYWKGREGFQATSGITRTLYLYKAKDNTSPIKAIHTSELKGISIGTTPVNITLRNIPTAFASQTLYNIRYAYWDGRTWINYKLTDTTRIVDNGATTITYAIISNPPGKTALKKPEANPRLLTANQTKMPIASSSLSTLTIQNLQSSYFPTLSVKPLPQTGPEAGANLKIMFDAAV
jgi:hypothetical protein